MKLQTQASPTPTHAHTNTQAHAHHAQVRDEGLELATVANDAGLQERKDLLIGRNDRPSRSPTAVQQKNTKQPYSKFAEVLLEVHGGIGTKHAGGLYMTLRACRCLSEARSLHARHTRRPTLDGLLR